jgi:thiol-disulfide isomerase/thioredoxin
MNNSSFYSTLALFCVGVILLASCAQSPQNLSAAIAPIAPAPDFPPALQWLNVDKPLTLQNLRGKVVLLDFWTLGCINCMHVIPDLDRLQAKYGNALAIIGVHSAKFAGEKGADAIRDAILRYGITHPVVNDKDFEIWNSYGVSAWPTFVLLDPDGNIVTAHSGEGPYEAFDQPIGELITQFAAEKKINRDPLPLHLEKDKAPPTPLRFPGKIAAQNGKLYISDSNHNRLVILNASDGSILNIIGQGAAGLKDGSLTEAQFSWPQGLAVDGQTIYVADTNNHAIRKVDLAAGTVTTLAGDGHQARDFNVPGRGTAVELSSPWDVLLHDGTLYIAMAGMHQIWSLNLKTLDAASFAGSGLEGLSDGPLAQAEMAQPSGLATDGTHLFSADSESSSIRQIDFDPAGSVHTIVGRGLFDFGDVDGAHDSVLIQHPLGLTFHEARLYVADTYNNKIKLIDPTTGQTQTLIGAGPAGFADGPALKAELNEPGGLVFDQGKLYIADTNNNLIREYDPANKLVTTLQIADASRLLPSAPSPAKFVGSAVTLGAQHVAPGSSGIVLNVTIPAGYKFNAAAPFYIGVMSDDPKIAQVDSQWAGQNVVNANFPLKVPLRLAPGQTHLTIDLVVYYCETVHESLCLVKRLQYAVPIDVSSQATAHAVNVDVNVAAPPAP